MFLISSFSRSLTLTTASSFITSIIKKKTTLKCHFLFSLVDLYFFGVKFLYVLSWCAAFRGWFLWVLRSWLKGSLLQVSWVMRDSWWCGHKNVLGSQRVHPGNGSHQACVAIWAGALSEIQEPLNINAILRQGALVQPLASIDTRILSPPVGPDFSLCSFRAAGI